jgi:hypothetical protein
MALLLVLAVLLGSLATSGDARSVPVYDVKGLLVGLTREDRARLRACPCPRSSDEALGLCLPVDFGGERTKRKEVFAFSVATDDRWRHYDWEKVGSRR